MRESRLSGSVEGVSSNPDPYSDSPEPWSISATKSTPLRGADDLIQSFLETWRKHEQRVGKQNFVWEYPDT